MGLLFGGTEEDGVWQDREIRFDNPPGSLAMNPGEAVLETVFRVEDTKGNNGELGTLVITNLRLMWISDKQRKTNLSIGLNCVVKLSMNNTSSRLKGSTQAVVVLTKFNASRFEFIFTNIDANNTPSMFNTVQTVFQEYDNSRMFRELRLRGHVLKDKELLVLPGERICSKVGGAWNLSSEQGNLGTFFITDVRLVWHANLTPTFNVSIPYVQMRRVGVRESKFGQALVVETTSRSGSYILGFKVDPEPKLRDVAKEIAAMFQISITNPNFGVNYAPSQTAATAEVEKTLVGDEDVDIVEGEGGSDVFAAYYADGATHAGDREPLFSPELGLAVEGLQDGVTVEQLWTVL